MRSRDSYDVVASEYARHIAGELAHKPFDREMLARFASDARAVSEGGSLPVLDLGCGPGHVTRYLHDLGVQIVGVDLSPGMLREARRLNPDIEFREGDMRSLDWPDGSVAAIVAPYSILHIPREEVVAVLGECRRVLLSGARSSPRRGSRPVEIPEHILITHLAEVGVVQPDGQKRRWRMEHDEVLYLRSEKSHGLH